MIFIKDEATSQEAVNTDWATDATSVFTTWLSYCVTTKSLGITGQWIQWLLLGWMTISSRVSVPCSIISICLLSLQRSFSLSVTWSEQIRCSRLCFGDGRITYLAVGTGFCHLRPIIFFSYEVEKGPLSSPQETSICHFFFCSMLRSYTGVEYKSLLFSVKWPTLLRKSKLHPVGADEWNLL